VVNTILMVLQPCLHQFLVAKKMAPITTVLVICNFLLSLMEA